MLRLRIKGYESAEACLLALIIFEIEERSDILGLEDYIGYARPFSRPLLHFQSTEHDDFFPITSILSLSSLFSILSSWLCWQMLESETWRPFHSTNALVPIYVYKICKRQFHFNRYIILYLYTRPPIMFDYVAYLITSTDVSLLTRIPSAVASSQ